LPTDLDLLPTFRLDVSISYASPDNGLNIRSPVHLSGGCHIKNLRGMPALSASNSRRDVSRRIRMARRHRGFALHGRSVGTSADGNLARFDRSVRKGCVAGCAEDERAATGRRPPGCSRRWSGFFD